MQYVLRTRDSGSHPFLVVRDTDGEIMGSYKTETEAGKEIKRLGDGPYWESLIRAWNAISRTPLDEDVPHYFSRTDYSKGITEFVGAILEIVAGAPEWKAPWMLRLEEVQRRYAAPGVIREWLREDRAKLAPEITGVRQNTEKLGRWASRSAQGESDPIRKLAYEAVQTLAAVVLDSMQDYPACMGNAFAHRAVDKSLQSLREAISRACPTQTASGDTEGSTGLRNVLGPMLPG